MSNVSGDFERRRQIACIGLGVYYESRGESVHGQRAVASVIINRTHSARYPSTPCEVIFQRGQFSFVRMGVLNPVGAAWTKALAIGEEFIDRQSTENNFLFFSSERNLHGYRIGGHIFR